MKTNYLKNISAASALVLTLASCNAFNPGPLTENIVGDTPGELKAKIVELLEQAGTDSCKVEFAEINSSFLYRPNDPTAGVYIQIISPKDKNKMEEHKWNDMKDRRNMYEQSELVVSTFLSNDLVDSYEGYKDMLFTYNDIVKYLDKLPVYCKEALESSGYKDKGYINSFKIDVEGASIGVGYKDKTGMSKSFKISDDKEHIITN